MSVQVSPVGSYGFGRRAVLPQDDIKDIASVLGANTLAMVQRPSRLFPVEQASVHRLVDALAGSSDGRGADGGRPLDGLGVDAHGRVFTTHSIVASGGLGLGVTGPFGLFLDLFLGNLKGPKIIARLDEVVVAGVICWFDIVSVRKGKVRM